MMTGSWYRYLCHPACPWPDGMPGTAGRILLVLVIAFQAVPPAAFGGISDFIPRIYSTEGELQFGGLYDSYSNSAAGRKSDQTDAYISERFVFTTTGYVYHPRFLQFLGQFAVGFNQEKYTQTNPSPSVDESWQNVFKGEYELRALVLPEHPYNLEAYTLRKEPMVRGLSAGLFKSVITSSGAIFKYKERPFNLTLSYDHSNIESRTFTTDYDTFAAGAGYTKDWGSFWGGYNHTESDTTQGGFFPVNYTQDSYGLGNQLNFWGKKILLVSTVTENKFAQDTYRSSVDDDRRTWKEQLNMYLPWNFDVSMSYRYEDDEQTTRMAALPSEVTLWSKTNNAIFQVTQRLYQSLVTSYSYNYYTIDSSGGDSTSTSQVLTSSYRKKIPRGYFNAGISLGRSITEGNGAPTVLNEIHTSPIWGAAPPPAGEFPLSGVNIDEASLEQPGAVQFKSVQTGEILPLPRSDYLVIRDGNTLKIRILSVPAEHSSPDLLHAYEFRVSYTLVGTQFEQETTNYAYSLRLDLFDRFFNPYYNFSHTDRKVLSGYLPGGNETVTINTVGASCERPFYTIIAEYQDYNSTFNPTKTFRAEGTAWDTFNETTTLTANAYYMNRAYGEVPQYGTPGYTEVTLGGRVRGEKKYPRQNLTASLAVNYWQTDGMILTRSSQAIAQLAWKVGQVDLNLGAEIGKNETELLIGKQEVNHNLFYLTIKRKLF